MNTIYKVENVGPLIKIDDLFFVNLEQLYTHLKQLNKLDTDCYKNAEDSEHYLAARDYITENLVKEFYLLEDLDINENIKNAYIVFKLWYLVRKEFSFIGGIYSSLEPRYFPRNLNEDKEVFTFSVPNECEDIDNLVYALEYNPKDYNMIFLTNEILEVLDKDDMILFNNFLSHIEVQKLVSSFNEIKGEYKISETLVYTRTFNRKLRRLKKVLRNLNEEL